ncbi:hypothetical protein TKK_0011322 [Trichogramma kaykai]
MARRENGKKKKNHLKRVSLLRKNHKAKISRIPRSLPNNNSIEPSTIKPGTDQVELYTDNSVDSLVFAAQLGLMSKHCMPVRRMSANAENLSENVIECKANVKLEGRKNKNSRKSNQKGSRNNGMNYSCSHCGKGYRWKSTMKRHEVLECGGKQPTFQCTDCNYKARQRGNLTVHMKRHHQKSGHNLPDDDSEKQT